MSGRQVNREERAGRGNAIAELPGAMMILLFFIFIPLLNICGLAIKYGSVATLNTLQVREAALLPKSQATAAGGAVKKSIPDKWAGCGLGAFVNATSSPETDITYRDGQVGPDGIMDHFVAVRTKVTMPPFLTAPTSYMPAVPGLSAPLTFTVESERPLENPFNFNS